MSTVRLRVDTEASDADAAEVFPAYVAVWPETDQEAWREEVWDRHVARTGFRLVRAYDGGEGGALLGFGYGYTGERGQWFTDHALGVLTPEVARSWLDGHFELVSIGVVPEARERGIGTALLREVSDVQHDRLVLMTTDEADDPARRLYAREGWQVLGPGVAQGTVILGRRGSRQLAWRDQPAARPPDPLRRARRRPAPPRWRRAGPGRPDRRGGTTPPAS